MTEEPKIARVYEKRLVAGKLEYRVLYEGQQQDVWVESIMLKGCIGKIVKLEHRLKIARK